jgi:uncharacterized membrane protein
MPQNKKNKAKKIESNISKALPYILILCGFIGIIASFILTYDKIQVLRDPGYSPPCNINPVLSCGSVMKTEQASLLGVPNTIFGLMGFTALVTFGFLQLSGAKFKKWIWQSAQFISTVGVVFMQYLFFQGVYRINAICPWCFVTWMITIPIFVYITAYNMENKIIPLPSWAKGLYKFIPKNYLNILFAWYAAILLILLQHFWYYWQTIL